MNHTVCSNYMKIMTTYNKEISVVEADVAFMIQTFYDSLGSLYKNNNYLL